MISRQFFLALGTLALSCVGATPAGLQIAQTPEHESSTVHRSESQWLPSWGTTIQTTEPRNGPPPLSNTTLRQFIWPTLSGQDVRIQLSNEKGSEPVEILQVHVAKAKTQDRPGNSEGLITAATDATFTFDGVQNVAIPAGETRWSDPLRFDLQELELTAISMQFGEGIPSEVTGHPGSRTTSYVASGDWVGAESLKDPETRDRWYFINAVEVMAPSDSYAIAVLGDSITDGYGVLNEFARWPDFLTSAIKNDPKLSRSRSVLNFGMGANNLTVTGEHQDSGVLRFERDVLTRDKIKWLVVLEGINDIVYSNVQAQPLKDAYAEIIEKAHAKGILVYGSPILPTERGPAEIRQEVNDFIRNEAGFDAILHLDKAVDPTGAGILAPQFNNDGLHPNAAGYEAMGKAVDLSLFYDETLKK